MGGPCFERLSDGRERELKELDNFYPASFVIDGKEWPSAEHFFQASKFPTDSALYERIRSASSCVGPSGCYMLGQSPGRIVENWNEVRVAVMYRANKAKYEQNPELAAILCSTTGPLRALGNENEWALWNAILLERIREELRPAGADQEVLANRIIIMTCLREVQGHENSRHSLFTSRLVRAVAKLVARREDPRALVSRALKDRFAVTCDGDLAGGEFAEVVSSWQTSEWFIDPLEPLVNDHPHLLTSTESGTKGHLYCGKRHGVSKWIISESFDPGEIGGELTMTMPSSQQWQNREDEDDEAAGSSLSSLPIGTFSWDCYTGGALAVTVYVGTF